MLFFLRCIAFHLSPHHRNYRKRNNTGLEVDVIVEQAHKLQPIEIKSGATLTSDWFKVMNQWLKLAEKDATTPALVYGGDTPWNEGPVRCVPWLNLNDLASSI